VKTDGGSSWESLLTGVAAGFGFCAVLVALSGGEWRVLVLLALGCVLVAWLVRR
jgi:hypothetical protein